jgi:hypothetical protein
MEGMVIYALGQQASLCNADTPTYAQYKPGASGVGRGLDQNVGP